MGDGAATREDAMKMAAAWQIAEAIVGALPVSCQRLGLNPPEAMVVMIFAQGMMQGQYANDETAEKAFDRLTDPRVLLLFCRGFEAGRQARREAERIEKMSDADEDEPS